MALILITDIGYDPDDLVALLYLIKRGAAPDLIVTSDEVAGKRYRFLLQLQHRGLASTGYVLRGLVSGVDLGRKNFLLDAFMDPALASNSPLPMDYEDCMEETIMRDPSPSTIISIGSFSEVAGFVRKHRALARSTRCRFFQMGGALDYERTSGWVEHNVKIDVASARYVLHAAIDLTLVGSQTTFDARLQVNPGSRIYSRFAARSDSMSKLVVDHFEAFHEAKNVWSIMHDPLTCSVALGEKFVEFEQVKIVTDAAGRIERYAGGWPIKISRPKCDAQGFMRHMEDVLLGSS